MPKSLDQKIDKIARSMDRYEGIVFLYPGEEKRQFIEPHALGIHKETGMTILKGYKIHTISEPESMQNWRIFEVEQMTDIRSAGIRIKQGRKGNLRKDREMSEVLKSIE